MPNASAVIFKKAAYLQVNDENTKMKFCGDWLLWVKLLQTGNIAYTCRPLNFFRKHGATTRVFDSTDKLKRRLDEDYAVLQYINKNIGISSAILKKRTGSLASFYNFCFTGKELLRFVFSPSTYQGEFPLRDILFRYLKIKVGKAIRLVQKTFGT